MSQKVAYSEKKGERYKSNKNYQFWQKRNHPKILFTSSVIYQKLHYLHQNPVVQGWVKKPEEYWYSSAKYYLKKEGGLKMDVLDFDEWEDYRNPFV